MSSSAQPKQQQQRESSVERKGGGDKKGGRKTKKKVGGSGSEGVKHELTEEQKAYLRAKFLEEQCTKLIFLYKDGSKEERLFEGTRMEHYSELLRLIAKVKPRSTALYMCQFFTGEILTPKNFKTVSTYRVREMIISKPLSIKYCPRVDTRWDFLEHHAGPPHKWVDKLQLKEDAKLKAQQDTLAARRQEDEARRLMERLENGGEEEEDGAWDDL